MVDVGDKIIVHIFAALLSMDLTRNQIVTEEPLSGWLRYEKEGEKPWFKTPAPRVVIRDASKLRAFLDKEHNIGRMLDVNVNQFSFKRRLGLRQKKNETVAAKNDDQNDDIAASVDEVAALSDVRVYATKEALVDKLTKRADILDHRKLLCSSSKEIDEFRENASYNTPEGFDEIKKNISSSNDLREMLGNLNKEAEIVDALNLLFTDNCLAEISRINSKVGPMVEFPASINKNVYCQIVSQGMQTCPSLMVFIINMVVRRGEPVLPSDVLKIASLYSNICYAANQNLDALVKLRSLSLQCDGLSNTGLDMLSDMGLAQCARSLSNHRDQLADIGPEVIHSTAAQFPYQSTLDNCDLMAEHLTVETVEKEMVDTSGLSTAKKSKEEAVAMFGKNLVLLGLEENKEELDHLMYVVALAIARVLVQGRPEASSKLSKHLPAHHTHTNSQRKLVPAVSFIVKPYPYQETRNPDTIKLLIRIQRQFLKCVAKSKGDDPSFHLLLTKGSQPKFGKIDRI